MFKVVFDWMAALSLPSIIPCCLVTRLAFLSQQSKSMQLTGIEDVQYQQAKVGPIPTCHWAMISYEKRTVHSSTLYCNSRMYTVGTSEPVYPPEYQWEQTSVSAYTPCGPQPHPWNHLGEDRGEMDRNPKKKSRDRLNYCFRVNLPD